jgi:hypothetical protein
MQTVIQATDPLIPLAIAILGVFAAVITSRSNSRLMKKIDNLVAAIRSDKRGC